jgi:outer membrane murein-binding lipoprotein Lpp
MREQTGFSTRRSAMGTASATRSASVGARISLIACLLLGICGIALVLHCSGCDTSVGQQAQAEPAAKELQELRGQVEALNEAVQQLRGQVEALNKTEQQLHRSLARLNAVTGAHFRLVGEAQQLHRSLAQLNGELPEDVRKEMDKTLEDLQAKENWPKNKEEAEQLRKKMTELVNSLPTSAVERNRDKLILVGWILDAICWKFEYQNPAAEQLSKALDEVDELLEQGLSLSKSVDRIEPTLKEGVTTLLKELERLRDDFQKRDFDVLIEQVENKAADAKKAELESLYQRLKRWDGAWESDRERKEKVQKYLPQLRCRLILYELDELEGKLKEAANEGETVRSVVALRVQSVANALLAEFCNDQGRQTLKPAIDRAQGLAQQASKVLEDIRVRKVQNYQRWALDQIKEYMDEQRHYCYSACLEWVRNQLSVFAKPQNQKPEDWRQWVFMFDTFGEKFQSDFKALIQRELQVQIQLNNGRLGADDMDKINKAAWGILSWKNDIDKKLAALIASEAMVYYLLRIERELLEPPLAQLWQEAWNKGWKDLEGQQEYRVRVGLRSTQVRKVRPEDL